MSIKKNITQPNKKWLIWKYFFFALLDFLSPPKKKTKALGNAEEKIINTHGGVCVIHKIIIHSVSFHLPGWTRNQGSHNKIHQFSTLIHLEAVHGPSSFFFVLNFQSKSQKRARSNHLRLMPPPGGGKGTQIKKRRTFLNAKKKKTKKKLILKNL